MKRFLVVALLAVVALGGVLIARAVMMSSRQIAVPPAPPLEIDRDAALERFSRAIQFRTVSHEDRSETTQHDLFVSWLEAAYPAVHATLEREVVGGHSLLYTWRGSDPSLAPILLMGHYDVVPVEPGTEAQWEHPPFSGAISGGFVWGRGTLDDKISVIGLMEAAESLAAAGHRPRRSILLAFGHDEEIGGENGAKQIAALLSSRGVRLEAVIDEGGLIIEGIMPGLTRPAAVIGIAEKGSVSVMLTSSGTGGHSSMPPPMTEVGVIARAVDRVQTRPMRARVRGATREMFGWLAPEVPFGQRLILANLWLFEPLVAMQATRSNSINAMLRTTTAPTIIAGGVKDNVIPSHAHAVVNFRILPGDTVDGVVAHVRQAVNDASVKIEPRSGWNPSAVSDPRSPQFGALQRTITQVYPGVVVTPYLVLGATDARHFGGLSKNVYRFLPARLHASDLSRFHGANERISVEDYFEAIRFYRTLIGNVE